MAKDQKPADQMDAFRKQAMAQAHEALEIYFDFLKKSVSSFPSGGTELGEELQGSECSKHHRCRELVKAVELKRRILKKHFELRPNLCSPNFRRLVSRLKVLARRYQRSRRWGQDAIQKFA